MKWHYKLAKSMGYDLVRSERNRWVYERHLSNVLNLYGVDLVLDVGANCGQFASGLREYGYTGDILSFEPVTACHNILSEKSSADQKWKTEKLALGSAVERKDINIPKSTVFSSFLKANDYSHQKFSGHLDDIITETIDITTLDLYMAEKKISTAKKMFLKIDTQGFDMNVLLGAKNTLSKLVGVSSELSFMPLYEQSAPHTDVLSFLKQNNFSISNIFPVSFDEKALLLVEADCVAINNAFVKSN